MEQEGSEIDGFERKQGRKWGMGESVFSLIDVTHETWCEQGTRQDVLSLLSCGKRKSKAGGERTWAELDTERLARPEDRISDGDA